MCQGCNETMLHWTLTLKQNIILTPPAPSLSLTPPPPPPQPHQHHPKASWTTWLGYLTHSSLHYFLFYGTACPGNIHNSPSYSSLPAYTQHLNNLISTLNWIHLFPTQLGLEQEYACILRAVSKFRSSHYIRDITHSNVIGAQMSPDSNWHLHFQQPVR